MLILSTLSHSMEMVPRSSVEYLSRPRRSDLTSPVIRSPFRIQTESVFCASAVPAARRRHSPTSVMRMSTCA